MTNKLKQLAEAIESTTSKLAGDIGFEIGGFTSPEIRHLMNNLGAISTRYFEIGTHRGALTISTLYGNNHLESFICDNWSEFETDDVVRQEFYSNIDRYAETSSIRPPVILETDCFTIPDKIKSTIKADLYLYDGGHGYEEQVKAITDFASAMADECIIVVDDYNWEDVQRGTQDGLKQSGLIVLGSGVLPDWHNGIGIFLVQKP